MPKTQIPLSGWQQTPDEHAGQPRIARLTNTLLDNQGRLLKSPGFAAVPIAADRGAITRAVALGGNFIAFHETTAFDRPGFRTAKLKGSAWIYDIEDHAFLSAGEAPRLTKIFGDENSHYINQGILTCGNGDLVIYAERLSEWIPGENDGDVGTFSDSYVGWCLLSADSGLQPTKYGEIGVVGGLGHDYSHRCFPSASGPYLVVTVKGPTNQNVKIYKWNTAANVFDLVTTLALPSVSGRCAQIDVSYSALWNVLLILMPSGTLYAYNLTSGTLLGSVAMCTPGVQGALGLGVIHDWGGSGSCAVVAFQSTTKIWSVCDVFFNATGFDAPSTAETLVTSPQDLPNTTFTYWVKRPEICATGNRLFGLFPYRQIEAAYDACVVEVTSCEFSYAAWTTTVVIHDSVGTSYHRYAVTKPVIDPMGKPVWWTGDSSGNSIRDAALSGGGFTYANLIVHDRSLALIAGDPGVSPAQEYLGSCGPMAYSVYLPPIRHKVYNGTQLGTEYRRGWVAALAVQKTTSNPATNVYLATVAEAWSTTTYNRENRADVGQMASVRGVTYVASGQPLAYTTVPDCAGFSRPPPPVVFTYSATGNSQIGETHQIVTVLRYENEAGETMWGPLSDPQRYTFAAVGSVLCSCYFHGIAPAEWKASLFVYQQVAGVYHLLNGPSGADYRTLWQLRTYSNTDAPAAIGAEPILYTQGALGAAAGQLEHFGCPPCRTIWAGRNRVICGGLWNERRVQFSNLFFPTNAVSWPRNAAFYSEVDEPVTAVASQDDFWFVFSATNIWVITGAGPDNMGNGTFDDPLRCSTGIGCYSWRSVVETPMGLMFQGNTGQIYLIPKGATSPTCISQAIRDSIANYNDTEPREPSIWVQGAVYDAATQEVIFTTYGADWVLQLETLAWRRETVLTATPAPNTAVSAGRVNIPNEGYTGPALVRTDTAGNRYVYRPRRRSEANTHLDAAGQFRYQRIETSDIDLGRGRIRRGWMRVLYASAGVGNRTIPYTVSVWFDGKRRALAADETRGFAGLELAVDNFQDLEFCFARQKCNQVRLVISDAPGVSNYVADHILGLWLDLVPSKESPIKTTTGNGRFA